MSVANPWWREGALAIVGTLAVAAAGAAINVRDRVASVEARQDKAEAVQAVRDQAIIDRLERIESYMKDHLP